MIFEEAYFLYVDEDNPRRTQLTGKRSIYVTEFLAGCDVGVGTMVVNGLKIFGTD